MSLTDEYLQELNDFMARMAPRAPRSRYFQKGNGPMFSWTTKRMDGLYGSFVHVPVGAGSKTGKAREWLMDDDSISSHKLRKDAKARALRLFEAWKAGDPHPW